MTTRDKRGSLDRSLVAPTREIVKLERRLFLRQGLSLGALTMLSGCDVTDADSVQKVLWSLSRNASTMPAFTRGSHYAINILASDQRHIAERFASKDIDRFEGVALREGTRGAPILEGAMAVFECFNRSQYAEGDHIIFVGEVEHCQRREDAQPLIYHGGRFFTELPL